MGNEVKKGKSDMAQEIEYFAFISYKSEDVEWAIWLQHELEHYHLPASFNGRTDVRQDLRPVFRDIDELSAGNLPSQIEQALANSQNLIVICSPQAAKSPWVNQEVETFISLGRTDRIFPFIVEGNSPSEFFPPALLGLPKNEERLGGDVSKNGRDAAFVKIVAGMLGVGYDSLWKRYEKEKAEEERKQREQRDKLLIAQSRFVAEKAISLMEDNSYLSRRLLLEVLPNNLEFPNRPLTSEVEFSLRESCKHNTFVLDGGEIASYSWDGRYIVSASHEKFIKIWDVNTGMLIRTLYGFADCVNEVRFSPDGTQIALISSDRTIKIIDAEDGKLIKELKGHTDFINFFAYSMDGKRLVSASSDKTIRVWNVECGEPIMVLNGHADRVMSASFSKDNQLIVSISVDKTVRVWNGETGENIHTYTTESNNVNSVCFSPDGRTLISNDHDIIRVWDVESGRLQRSIHVNDTWGTKINCVTFSPSGQLIASTCCNKVKIWEANTGRLKKTINGVFHGNGINDIYSVSFSPDGNNVMYCSNNKIWTKDIEPAKSTRSLGSHRCEGFSFASYSPDGSQIVSGSGNYLDDDYSIRIWGANFALFDSHEGWTKFEGHTWQVNSVAFSMDGEKIVSASSDHNVKIWETKTGRLIHTLEIINRGIIHAANFASFSPNAKLVVTASDDAIVRIWDAENGVELLKLQGHTSSVNSVFFSSDGKLILSASGESGGDDNSIRIWNANDGLELMRMKGHLGGVNTAAFSPDDKYIVSASRDNTVRIWSTETGKEIDVLRGHTDEVNTAFFSHDGNRIVSASNDHTVKVWDLLSGTVQTLDDYSGKIVKSAQFSPDDNFIVSASWHMKIWSFCPLQALINETRERFRDYPLTPEERHKYYLE